MARKKNKSDRFRVNLYSLLILFFLVVFVYIFIGVFSRISQGSIEIQVVDFGEIQKTITKDVVVVRKNLPIKSGRSGVLTRFYQQGDRVPKDAVVCKIQDSREAENEIAGLNKINMKIEDINNNSSSYNKNAQDTKLKYDIDYLYSIIQDKIIQNEFKSVSNLKEELSHLIYKKNVENTLFIYDDMDLQTLLAKKKEIETKLLSNKIYLRSPQSGMISYYSDGFEDKFSFDNIKNITVKDIKEASNSAKRLDFTSVQSGDLIAYVVDNHYYYIATEVEKSDIESIRRDTKLSIIIDDVNFNAYLYDFYKDAHGKFVGLFKVESEDYDFLKRRKENATIVYDYAKGMLVPNKAIVENNGKKGVYKVDEVGVAKFVLLGDILTSDEKNTLVFFSYDDFKDKTRLQLYDNIILTTKDIKEGQKVR